MAEHPEILHNASVMQPLKDSIIEHSMLTLADYYADLLLNGDRPS